MNTKTHMIGDDYVYSFLYQTPYRLSSINDIIESQYSHYYLWGGRSVVHFIAQAILLINNNLAINIINSLAFIVFIYLIYYHVTAGRKKSISLLLIVFSLIWLLQPAFAETTLWITGSANYLWGISIILLFMLPYRLYKDNKINLIKDITCSVLIFLFGIIAGWTNENTAAAMIVMLFLYLFYYRFKKFKISLWMYSGILGSLLGYLIMVSAPGNFIRAEGTSISPFLIVFRLLTYTNSLVHHVGLLNLGITFLLILYLKFVIKTNKSILSNIFIIYIGTLISIYIMVASPGFPPRAWFGPITFNIIILGIVLYNLDYSQAFFRQIKYSLFFFCMIAFAFSFYEAYNDVTNIDKIWKERFVILEQKKKQHIDSVTFKEYQPRTKFGLGDTPYALKYISQYYNIDFQLEK